ncbi:MAG: SDR family NAD(P)-dependent oxidoreductase [Herpetosiphon sp.]
MAQPVCVVVGVGPGIGLAVAARFGREGFAVAMLARRRKALDHYVAELASAGITSQGIPTNAADRQDLRASLETVKRDLGPPDVLIYNVAAVHAGPPMTLRIADLESDFAVNVGGALVATQQVVPEMRAKQRGTILFTGGGLALEPNPAYASLAVGKAGLRNLCFSLAGELEPLGIHVATVTIQGFVKPGSHFDPERIADVYWALHTEATGQWRREHQYH